MASRAARGIVAADGLQHGAVLHQRGAPRGGILEIVAEPLEQRAAARVPVAAHRVAQHLVAASLRDGGVESLVARARDGAGAGFLAHLRQGARDGSNLRAARVARGQGGHLAFHQFARPHQFQRTPFAGVIGLVAGGGRAVDRVAKP